MSGRRVHPVGGSRDRTYDKSRASQVRPQTERNLQQSVLPSLASSGQYWNTGAVRLAGAPPGAVCLSGCGPYPRIGRAPVSAVERMRR